MSAAGDVACLLEGRSVLSAPRQVSRATGLHVAIWGEHMLESIRKSQRWLTGILVALVGGVFVFFMGLGGPLQSDAPTQGLVVELGDIRLAPADFLRVRAQQADALRDRLGDQLGNQAIAGFLDTQALRLLVDRAVLAHEAHSLGLRVGKREIQRLIRSSPSFRDAGGKFDNESFTNFVEYEYGSQRNYLEFMRQSLLGQKMAQLLYGQAGVSDGEARSAVLYRLQQVRIAYVALDPAVLSTSVELTDEELASYVASHDEELRLSYSMRQPEFSTPAQMRLRHILFAVGSDASEEEVASAREKADAALVRLRDGEAFGVLAGELSEDESTRDTGGDLGLITADDIASELVDAAAALEPGSLSEVTRSDNGLHIVLLEERVRAGIRPFEEVREQLASDGAKQRRAGEIADDRSDRLATAIRAGTSLEDAARELELTIERTALIRRRADGYVIGLGASNDLLATAFALNLENPSSAEIFTVGSKLVLIQLLERQEPDDVELTEALLGERERLETGKRASFVQNWVDARKVELIRNGELLIDSSIIEGS